MRSFAYAAPASVKEAVALLAERGAEARPLAGGTDLLVLMRHGQLAPQLLVDVKKIPELSEVTFSPAGGLTVGAAVPLASLCDRPELAAHYPGLLDAASLIGGTAIRSRATLGGNLCNAAPSGDSIPAMIVLHATCVIAGPRGNRTLPVERFCTAPRRTALNPGELLVAIHFPPPAERSGASYFRFTPRHEMDIAVAGVGASLVLGRDGHISAARIALGAVGPTPILAEAAGAALVGHIPGEEAFARAAELARGAAQPIDDVRGSVAQRRHLVGVLTVRALRRAAERARGGEDHA